MCNEISSAASGGSHKELAAGNLTSTAFCMAYQTNASNMLQEAMQAVVGLHSWRSQDAALTRTLLLGTTYGMASASPYCRLVKMTSFS